MLPAGFQQRRPELEAGRSEGWGETLVFRIIVSCAKYVAVSQYCA